MLLHVQKPTYIMDTQHGERRATDRVARQNGSLSRLVYSINAIGRLNYHLDSPMNQKRSELWNLSDSEIKLDDVELGVRRFGKHIAGLG